MMHCTPIDEARCANAGYQGNALLRAPHRLNYGRESMPRLMDGTEFNRECGQEFRPGTTLSI